MRVLNGPRPLLPDVFPRMGTATTFDACAEVESCSGGGIRAGTTDCGMIGRKSEAFTESGWRLEGEGVTTGGG